MIPVIVIAGLCVAAAAFGLFANASTGTLRGLIVGITCGAVLILAVSIMTGNAISRQVTGHLGSLRMQARSGQADLAQLAETALRGERPAALPPTPAPGRAAHNGDPFRLLAQELDQTQYVAGQVIAQLAQRSRGSARTDQRVEIFVNLARRMQSLVHREIELLDELEAQVEDPDLLKGLFTVDHLATRMRRQSESLAVLGGSVSRRQWTRQVSMHEVLRASVAEVEQYSRVKIVPPVEGVLRGAAVADVIHLIAELVENATKFSAPKTQALLRSQQVTAGIAIEIEDRGLGMVPADQQRLNAQLAEPGGIDIGELLQDGRLGLYVVSTLSHRHDIRVQLQNNIYGGTSAIVVLPRALLEDAAERQLPRGGDAARSSGPMGGGEQAPGTRTASAPASDVFGGRSADRELVTAPVAQTASPAAAASSPGGSPPWEIYPSSSAYVPQTSGGASRDPAGSADYASADYASSLISPSGYRPSPAYGTPTQHEAPGRYDSAGSFDAPSPTAAQPRREIPADERPPLPKRQVQASLAAELRDDGPVPPPARSRRGEEPANDGTPGLMADFLRGVSRSDASEDDIGTDGAAQ